MPAAPTVATPAFMLENSTACELALRTSNPNRASSPGCKLKLAGVRLISGCSDDPPSGSLSQPAASVSCKHVKNAIEFFERNIALLKQSLWHWSGAAFRVPECRAERMN